MAIHAAPAGFDPAKYPRKLNLGSGTDRREGYLNVDLNGFNRPDVVADVRKLDFLPSYYYDEILAQDILEHLPRTQTMGTLAHWNRLLRMDGVITLRVPSVLGLADLLRSTEYEAVDKQEELVQCLFGSQAYSGDFHFTTFTAVLLKHYLAEAGFATTHLDVMHGWLFDAAARKVRHLEQPPGRDFSGLLKINDAAFVHACFREILGRDPDPGGMAFYLNGLQSGGLERQMVIDVLLASPEHQALKQGCG